MDANLAIVVAAFVAATPPVLTRVMAQRTVRTATQERKDAALLGVEAAAYARARSYDQEVINSLMARIERAEVRMERAERRADRAERRVAILERTLLVNGIALPADDADPVPSLPPMVNRLIAEAASGEPTPDGGTPAIP